MSRKLLVLNPGNSMEVQFDQQITIGRDIFNTLCLQDPEISRSHAIIFEQEDEIIVKDLKSRNGIYVRGEKVQEAKLDVGDELIIGATVIIFDPADTLDVQLWLTPRGRYLLERGSGGQPRAIEAPKTTFKNSEMDAAIAQLLEGEGPDSTYLSMPTAIALLKTVNELDRAESTSKLFSLALTRAMEIVQGHRGVIMEADEGKEHLKVRSLITRDNSETINIGQPIVEIALGKEKCIYCPIVDRDPRFERMAAKSSHPIYSFAAAPIVGRGELFGLIYLDSEDASIGYDFAAVRSLYFIAAHVGALLCKRPIRFDHQTLARAKD